MTVNKNLCVKIAYDVLAQLREKRYTPTSGIYVDIHYWPTLYKDKSFKDVFKQDKKLTCRVCALGSCFVSLVNLENECSVEQMDDEGEFLTFERLRPIFGSLNMSLMESAFERRDMCDGYTDICDGSYEERLVLKAAAKWGMRWKDNKKRLRQIMLNIIRNKGDFKLPKKTIANLSRYT